MRARGLTPGLDGCAARTIVAADDAVARRLERSRPARPSSASAACARPTASRWPSRRPSCPLTRFAGLDDGRPRGRLAATSMLERATSACASAGPSNGSSPCRSRAAEAELLGVGADQPGLRFQTVARDATDAVVYEATSLFRGDRYEIALHQDRGAAAPATQPA